MPEPSPCSSLSFRFLSWGKWTVPIKEPSTSSSGFLSPETLVLKTAPPFWARPRPNLCWLPLCFLCASSRSSSRPVCRQTWRLPHWVRVEWVTKLMLLTQIISPMENLVLPNPLLHGTVGRLQNTFNYVELNLENIALNHVSQIFVGLVIFVDVAWFLRLFTGKLNVDCEFWRAGLF